jgi:hypothetical protein
MIALADLYSDVSFVVPLLSAALSLVLSPLLSIHILLVFSSLPLLLVLSSSHFPL